MKLSRRAMTLFSMWSVAGAASAALNSLRAGRRDGDRLQLVHGLASLLAAVTAAVVLIRDRRRDNLT